MLARSLISPQFGTKGESLINELEKNILEDEYLISIIQFMMYYIKYHVYNPDIHSVE